MEITSTHLNGTGAWISILTSRRRASRAQAVSAAAVQAVISWISVRFVPSCQIVFAIFVSSDNAIRSSASRNSSARPGQSAIPYNGDRGRQTSLIGDLHAGHARTSIRDRGGGAGRSCRRLHVSGAAAARGGRASGGRLGPLHPDVANTLNNLGVVCEITGKPDEAEQCFRRAYEIAIASLEPDHPFVATSRKNLEDFCAARGKPVGVPTPPPPPPTRHRCRPPPPPPPHRCHRCHRHRRPMFASTRARQNRVDRQNQLTSRQRRSRRRITTGRRGSIDPFAQDGRAARGRSFRGAAGGDSVVSLEG